jgi:hypothetical protein
MWAAVLNYFSSLYHVLRKPEENGPGSREEVNIRMDFKELRWDSAS